MTLLDCCISLKGEKNGCVGSRGYAPASVKYIGVDFYAIGHTLL